MKLAIFGATGGTGRQLVEQALGAGYSVRALVRCPKCAELPREVQLVVGNVLRAESAAETVSGADAVLSCLGARLVATFTRRGRIVSLGTVSIVEAMRERGVRRLVAVSTYGAGDSWSRLGFGARLMMGSLLRGELADKNDMERVVDRSGLDWTVVRPVNLTSGRKTGHWLVDPVHSLGFRDWVSRSDVAAFMLQAIPDQTYFWRKVLLGGAPSGANMDAPGSEDS